MLLFLRMESWPIHLWAKILLNLYQSIFFQMESPTSFRNCIKTGWVWWGSCQKAIRRRGMDWFTILKLLDFSRCLNLIDSPWHHLKLSLLIFWVLNQSKILFSFLIYTLKKNWDQWRSTFTHKIICFSSQFSKTNLRSVKFSFRIDSTMTMLTNSSAKSMNQSHLSWSHLTPTNLFSTTVQPTQGSPQ